jgi:predicted  nucleic acid-binding Zn-ribbon protein
MSHADEIAGLQPHIDALQERAFQARRLAKEVTDRLAREGLLRHAEEFERRAQELEARLAVLKEAESPADPIEDIAALKPPPAEPEPES